MVDFQKSRKLSISGNIPLAQLKVTVFFFTFLKQSISIEIKFYSIFIVLIK
jgi:hypothetical protein